MRRLALAAVFAVCAAAGRTAAAQAPPPEWGRIDLVGAFDSRQKPSAGEAMWQALTEKGVEATVARYRELKEKSPNDYNFATDQVALVASRLLQHRRLREALDVYRLAAAEAPKETVLQARIGETSAALGDRGAALAAYRKALNSIRERIKGRESEPAESVFKNIELLKGKPASRLPGMMSALTGLIGVTCSTCHVPDHWESDELIPKQTARRHFKMQADLNRDYFGGANAVSCWTCHRGSRIPPIQ